MSFIVDKQTLEDLNVLGKYKQHSIFSLFNKVITEGGEQLLTAMFQNPLTDPQAINNRSAIFNQFQREQVEFPFSNEQFGIVENYLNGATAGNYPATLLTLARKKLLAVVVRDEEYPKIQSGLQQTITLLNDCKRFVSKLENGMIGSAFSAELLKAKNILNDPLLPTTESRGVEMSLFLTAKYDHILRHTMKPALTIVVEIFYQLDVYIAVAGLAGEKDFSYALALPKDHHVLSAAQLRHPNIDKAVGNPVS